MQRPDRWSEDPEEERPRPSSRRNSGSLSRRGSGKKEQEARKSAPASANSTPRRVAKPQHLDFVVTGKQISKRAERTNSLPGAYHRRPSADSVLKAKRPEPQAPPASKSRDASLEDDMSLDLSQVSDFEDTISKYGVRPFAPLATSSPKRSKPRSSSLQQQVLQQQARSQPPRSEHPLSSSRDSYRSTSSYRRAGSEGEPYWSGTPSSVKSAQPPDALASPASQDQLDSSSCVSWQECAGAGGGEWGHFWANYNNSVARVPVRGYYDQCPTPYRTDEFDLTDLEFSTDCSRKRSPENISAINNIIRNEGLHLTPRETQNIIKCAHILGNVLTKAIERRAKDDVTEAVQELDTDKEIKKRTMSLNLKETTLPIEVKEEKRWETATTQTDISLPNTKSAPKIFEKILRQLSRTSLDVPEKVEKEAEKDKQEKENKEDVKEVKDDSNA